MKTISVIFLSVLILQTCYAPPVSPNKKENGHSEEESDVNGLEDYMEYHRYLKEVVNALESDPEFRKKLEQADETEIKSGKIAEELEFVSHNVRTRLDELKRLELDRLKDLTEKKRQLEHPNSINEDPVHHHLDHSNPHTFEIEDLKKLIAKTTEDLAEADRKRRDQFKQYELEKEYKKQDKLNHTNGAEREKLEKDLKEMEEKHKKHDKLHEPGHKAQLEEVWEEQDQMQQDFDPKTFFMLHDIDGNGLWDQEEVKSLFIKELDKMYQQGAPEDDMRERVEEMERMRESVFKEMDTNRDGFIDFNEFWAQTNSNNFKQDNGWQGIDEQRPYTDEELAEYIRQHEYNQFVQGHSGQHVPPGGYQVPPGGYQQVPPGGYQQAPPQHPQAGYQQMPPGGYQQVPPGGYQQAPPGGYQQVPPGGYQQIPQGNHQIGQDNHHIPQGNHQVPPGGYQQAHQGNNQVPQGNQQVPPGGYHANAIPPQAPIHPGQVPQNIPQSGTGHLSNNDLNTNEVYPNQPQGYQHSGQLQQQNEINNQQQQHLQPEQKSPQVPQQNIQQQQQQNNQINQNNQQEQQNQPNIPNYAEIKPNGQKQQVPHT